MKLTSKRQSNYNGFSRMFSRWSVCVDVLCFVNAPKQTQAVLIIPDFYWLSRPLQLGTKPSFELTIKEIQAGDSTTHNLGLHSLSPGNTHTVS